MTISVELPLRRGAVGVIRRGQQFLVIRRAEGIAAPGAFCFPGGGIEADESEAEALVREFQEELGVMVVPVRRVWQSTTPWRVELFWWLAELVGDAVLAPNPLEVAAVHWYTKEEMLTLPDLLSSNRDFLKMLASGAIVLD